jgi:Domain of unknown function DUF29
MPRASLYDTDYYAWTQDQAATLRELAASRSNMRLDLSQLAEEVEDLGRNELRTVSSTTPSFFGENAGESAS